MRSVSCARAVSGSENSATPSRRPKIRLTAEDAEFCAEDTEDDCLCVPLRNPRRPLRFKKNFGLSIVMVCGPRHPEYHRHACKRAGSRKAPAAACRLVLAVYLTRLPQEFFVQLQVARAEQYPPGDQIII